MVPSGKGRVLLGELPREQETQDVAWRHGGRIWGGVGEEKTRWEMEERGEEQDVKRTAGRPAVVTISTRAVRL